MWVVVGAIAFAYWLIHPAGSARVARTPAGLPRTAAPAAVRVGVAAARQGDIPVHVSGLGSVSPFYTVNVKTRVDGQLLRVAFREGDLVKQGISSPRSIRVRSRSSWNGPAERWRATRRCSWRSFPITSSRGDAERTTMAR